MRTARRSSHEQGIRINYVAPCWIRSAIRTPEYEKWLIDRGIEFGEQKDVASCMMRIACDKSINGMFEPLRILYLLYPSNMLVPIPSCLCFAENIWLKIDIYTTGRSFMITPRSVAKEGFVDIDREDYKDVKEDEYLKKVQETQLVIIEDKWLDDYKVRVYRE